MLYLNRIFTVIVFVDRVNGLFNLAEDEVAMAVVCLWHLSAILSGMVLARVHVDGPLIRDRLAA